MTNEANDHYQIGMNIPDGSINVPRLVKIVTSCKPNLLNSSNFTSIFFRKQL